MHCFFLPFISNRIQVPSKKEEKKQDKPSEKDSKDVKEQDSKTNKSDAPSSNSGANAAKKDDKRHGRMLRFDWIHLLRKFENLKLYSYV